MTDALIIFGSEISDRDGALGQLTRVYFDPAELRASDLVVVPDDIAVTARLVPLELLAVGASGGLSLVCSRVEFNACTPAIDYETTPPPSGAAEVLIEVVTASIEQPMVAGTSTVASEHAPTGTVGISRSMPVLATDGRVGATNGVVLDLPDGRLIAIVISEGHLFAHRRVVLPADSLLSVDEDVHLRYSATQLKALGGQLNG